MITTENGKNTFFMNIRQIQEGDINLSKIYYSTPEIIENTKEDKKWFYFEIISNKDDIAQGVMTSLYSIEIGEMDEDNNLKNGYLIECLFDIVKIQTSTQISIIKIKSFKNGIESKSKEYLINDFSTISNQGSFVFVSSIIYNPINQNQKLFMFINKTILNIQPEDLDLIEFNDNIHIKSINDGTVINSGESYSVYYIYPHSIINFRNDRFVYPELAWLAYDDLLEEKDIENKIIYKDGYCKKYSTLSSYKEITNDFIWIKSPLGQGQFTQDSLFFLTSKMLTSQSERDFTANKDIVLFNISKEFDMRNNEFYFSFTQYKDNKILTISNEEDKIQKIYFYIGEVEYNISGKIRDVNGNEKESLISYKKGILIEEIIDMNYYDESSKNSNLILENIYLVENDKYTILDFADNYPFITYSGFSNFKDCFNMSISISFNESSNSRSFSCQSESDVYVASIQKLFFMISLDKARFVSYSDSLSIYNTCFVNFGTQKTDSLFNVVFNNSSFNDGDDILPYKKFTNTYPFSLENNNHIYFEDNLFIKKRDISDKSTDFGIVFKSNLNIDQIPNNDEEKVYFIVLFTKYAYININDDIIENISLESPEDTSSIYDYDFISPEPMVYICNSIDKNNNSLWEFIIKKQKGVSTSLSVPESSKSFTLFFRNSEQMLYACELPLINRGVSSISYDIYGIDTDVSNFPMIIDNINNYYTQLPKCFIFGIFPNTKSSDNPDIPQQEPKYLGEIGIEFITYFNKYKIIFMCVNGNINISKCEGFKEGYDFGTDIFNKNETVLYLPKDNPVIPENIEFSISPYSGFESNGTWNKNPIGSVIDGETTFIFTCNRSIQPPPIEN